MYVCVHVMKQQDAVPEHQKPKPAANQHQLIARFHFDRQTLRRRSAPLDHERYEGFCHTSMSTNPFHFAIIHTSFYVQKLTIRGAQAERRRQSEKTPREYNSGECVTRRRGCFLLGILFRTLLRILLGNLQENLPGSLQESLSGNLHGSLQERLQGSLKGTLRGIILGIILRTPGRG